MKKIMNNSGYSLFIVLLTIVIFSILLISFIGISTNTKKQSNVVETKLQSTALAEMGVTYFDQAVKNTYDTYHQQIINEVMAQRQADLLNDKLTPKPDDAYYRSMGIEKMKNRLINEINSLQPEVQIIGKANSKFVITPTDSESAINISEKIISTNNNGIYISYRSNGFEDGKKTIINGTLDIDFTGFILTKQDDNFITSLISNNKISDPGKLDTCPSKLTNNGKFPFNNLNCETTTKTFHNNDDPSFTSTTYKVNGTLTIPNMNGDIQNSTLYITEDLIAQNMNNINGGRIHVGKSLKGLNFNGQGLKNHSILEVTGSANMGTVKISEKSSIYIGGIAEMDNINNIDDSIIYVDSDATMGVINLGKNAKICVNGKLTSGNINNISSSSKVYAKESTNPNVITDKGEFDKACTASSQKTTWGNTTITSNYHYY